MPIERKSFIKVDELLPRVSVEQAAAHYGVPLPELRRIGQEIRSRCFLTCGKTTETGDRVLAIQADHPAKQWHCHQYGCGKSGNLVSLCDLLKPGANGSGRPRGERFKAIAADLRAMAGEVSQSAAQVLSASPGGALESRREPVVNVPLIRSRNEKARALTALDRKFIVVPSEMPPAASAYFRRRPFLTPDACQKWRMGYLPRDTGDDKSGGTMRGTVVYPVLSAAGAVLSWFGRNPAYEENYARWAAASKVDREPEKFHFVKGFHRGLELFGQHASRLQEPGCRKRLQELGLVVVEGPNDVIALDRLGVPAVALLSNTITQEQAGKVASWAHSLAGGIVTLMLDCDPEGENGARQALYELAQCCRVRLAWSPSMHAGRFKGRQPESLTVEEWAAIQGSFIATMEPNASIIG